LRKDKGRALKDYKLIPIEGNVLKAQQTFNQAEISTLCHSVAIVAALKGLLALQIYPYNAQAIDLDAAFVYPIELIF
jgi:hypothetical protein